MAVHVHGIRTNVFSIRYYTRKEKALQVMKMRGKLQIANCNDGTPPLQKSQGEIPCIIMNFWVDWISLFNQIPQEKPRRVFCEKVVRKEHQKRYINRRKNLIL